MRARGAGDIMAWLGPAIGPQRFEVGSDVLDAFTAYDAHSKTAFAPSPDATANIWPISINWHDAACNRLVWIRYPAAITAP